MDIIIWLRTNIFIIFGSRNRLDPEVGVLQRNYLYSVSDQSAVCDVFCCIGHSVKVKSQVLVKRSTVDFS